MTHINSLKPFLASLDKLDAHILEIIEMCQSISDTPNLPNHTPTPTSPPAPKAAARSPRKRRPDFRQELRDHFRQILFPTKKATVPWTNLAKWLFCNRKRLVNWPRDIALPAQGNDLSRYTLNQCNRLLRVGVEDWYADEGINGNDVSVLAYDDQRSRLWMSPHDVDNANSLVKLANIEPTLLRITAPDGM